MSETADVVRNEMTLHPIGPHVLTYVDAYFYIAFLHLIVQGQVMNIELTQTGDMSFGR